MVDKFSKQDLVFTSTPVYQRDSVYLTTTLPGYRGAMSYPDSNKFKLELTYPVDTFYLRLSITDIDTVHMNYNFQGGKCCQGRGYGKIAGITFNGGQAKRDGDIYLFEK